eukprot:m.254323 g.254323  ORF g.254323 m.254323 type:complete len:454 (+) comp17961_c0_seq1:253-1614(+)
MTRVARASAVLAVVVVVLLHTTTSTALPMLDLPSPSSSSSASSSSSSSSSFSKRSYEGTVLPPIIMIPGLTGASIDVELDGAPSVYGCPTNLERTTIWPPNITTVHEYLCFLENIKLDYNPVTNSLQDRIGEKTFVSDFGGFGGLPGYDTLLAAFTQAGYVLGKTFFAAPYDWRGPAVAAPDFFTNLTALVERAYEMNNNTRVTLLAPSYGPQFVLSFLHRQPQAWKDKYIYWFIAESPIWSGAPASIAAFISGYENGGMDPSSTRQLATETMSGFWLFPRAGNTNTTWGKDEVLARTPSKTYTSANYHELLEDLGFKFKIPALNYVVNDPDLSELQHPGVQTFVTFGYGIGTPAYFEWDQDFKRDFAHIPPQPSVVKNATDTGDSYVTVRSALRGLEEWKEPMEQANLRLLYKGYENQMHAYCVVPQGGACFYEVLDLIVHGIVPSNLWPSS